MVTMEIDIERLVEEYMALPYRIELIPDPDDGGYVATIPDLPGCISQGDTVAEAMDMIADAQRSWLLSALRHSDDIPRPSSKLKYNGKLLVRVPPFLHESLINEASRQGVSLNLYATILLAQGHTVDQLQHKLDRRFATLQLGIGAIHAHLRNYEFKGIPAPENGRRHGTPYMQVGTGKLGKSVAA